MRARVKNTRAYTRGGAEHPEHPEQACIHAGFGCSGHPEQEVFCPEQGSIFASGCGNSVSKQLDGLRYPAGVCAVEGLYGAG
jgi:hypothetical protein